MEKHIETILNDETLFSHYFQDQLELVKDDTKIYQLSTTFIQSLLSRNVTRSTEQRLNHFFADYEELVELLQLFEIGKQLIDYDNFPKLIEQFIDYDNEKNPPKQNDDNLYCLVLSNNQFYLIKPSADITTEEVFTCHGDPWIETSLMNLIELLVSRSVIQNVKNIEQLTSVYGQVAQCVLELRNYSVNNLECLRSFTSLLRCITALLPNDQALETFKNTVYYHSLDSAFKSCEGIHSIIEYLDDVIKKYQPVADSQIIRQSLLKLEMEFLKNWLVDNSDQYDEVLKLISKSEDMWQYSAKIFFYIERKLDLVSMVQDNHGRILDMTVLFTLDPFFARN